MAKGLITDDPQGLISTYDDNSNLVRDFVPVYRKSDSVVGLYDIQNGVFYSNANNSGDDFTAGPNVS